MPGSANPSILDATERAQKLKNDQEWFLSTARHNFKAMVAFLGLQNGGKYADFQAQVESAFATGAGDIYPTDLSSLAQTLIDERFSTPTKEWLEARAKRNNHKERNDRKPPAFDEKKTIEGLPAAVFYQSKAEGEFCYCCGSPDHKFSQCRVKSKIPKDQWAINKMKEAKVTFMQQYHQYAKCTFLNEQTQAPSAPVTAPAPTPTTVYYQQPPGHAPSVSTQSHRSGFTSPIPPQLQQTQPQIQSVQLPQFPTGAPPSTPQPPTTFHWQGFQQVIQTSHAVHRSGNRTHLCFPQSHNRT